MQKEINIELFKFYKTVFKSKINVFNALIQDYSNRTGIPKLSKEKMWMSNYWREAFESFEKNA